MAASNKIEFDFETRAFKNITVSQVKFWEEAYPDVNVIDHILKRMPAWIDGNADGKGRKKKWKRFIVGWLSRQQERYQPFRKE